VVDPDEDDFEARPTTPWVRSVVSGVDLLRNPKYNKGMAFTEEERDRLYLRGLLPPAVMNQNTQEQRVLTNVRAIADPLDKYTHLMALQERNELLFFHTVMNNLEELMPVVYLPTVALACQKYGLIFRRPRGLFISIQDKGRIFSLLKNWPERNVRHVIVSDGESVLGMGDLGIQGMGVAVSKVNMLVACGGLHPSRCLPVTIDVGTDNEDLLRDPFYIGLRHRRVRGEAYDDLMREFVEAIKRRFGQQVMINFEDFSTVNSSRLLLEFRGDSCTYNDDVQGNATVALAGLLGAVSHIGEGKLSDHTFLFAGQGTHGTSMAELLATYISRRTGEPVTAVRQRMWLFDSGGLVVRSRGESLHEHKLPYAHDHEECSDLYSAVKAINPSVLIGATMRAPQVASFSEDVVRHMATNHDRPIIFAMTQPDNRNECSAEDAYHWSDGRAVFASGILEKPVQMADGRWMKPGAALTQFVFPGICLGTSISGATRLREEMFISAAEALAGQVLEEDKKLGAVFPRLSQIQDVSASVAKAVAGRAYDLNLATSLPRPKDLLAAAKAKMYNPMYRRYR